MSWLLGVLGIAQLGVTPPPPATPTPAPSSDEVVVTGVAHRDVAKQVRAIARNIEDRPFARFQKPVCVASIGLSSSLGVEIVGRVMEDARALGVPASADGVPCQPNVILAFLDNGQGQIERLARKNYKFFEELTVEDMRELKRQRGPVQAVKLTVYRQEDGNLIATHPIRQPDAANAQVPNVPTDPLTEALGKGVMIVDRHSDATRLSPGFRQETTLSLVVFDRPALEGKTTKQIADYAAMRAFADIVPDPHAGAQTILSLFGDDAAHAPAELTAFDRGYLRGAYAAAAYAYPDEQEATITRSIDRELAKHF